MYEQFYGFRELPFELTANPRFLVLTDAHQEALSNLEYGIASRKGITLLVGDAGSGKTTVIRAAIGSQPERVHCVHLHHPTLSMPEFVEELAHRFGLSARAAASKSVMLRELEQELLARRARGESSVLVVDEAQRLSSDLLEEIRLLSNLESDEEKLLSIIIAGQPELAERLERPEFRQFKQRVALRCELTSLDLRESVVYVAGRIRAAGGLGRDVFTREALHRLHEKSRGVPRWINVIADNCLLGGFASGQKPIDASTVDEVCRDFKVGSSADEDAAGARRNGHRRPVDGREPGGTGNADGDRDRPLPELFKPKVTPRKRFLFF